MRYLRERHAWKHGKVEEGTIKRWGRGRALVDFESPTHVITFERPLIPSEKPFASGIVFGSCAPSPLLQKRTVNICTYWVEKEAFGASSLRMKGTKGFGGIPFVDKFVFKGRLCTPLQILNVAVHHPKQFKKSAA